MYYYYLPKVYSHSPIIYRTQTNDNNDNNNNNNNESQSLFEIKIEKGILNHIGTFLNLKD